MSNSPGVLLWTDTPDAYVDAVAQAGLDSEVLVDTLS